MGSSPIHTDEILRRTSDIKEFKKQSVWISDTYK